MDADVGNESFLRLKVILSAEPFLPLNCPKDTDGNNDRSISSITPMTDNTDQASSPTPMADNTDKTSLHSQRERAIFLGNEPTAGAERELEQLFKSPFRDVRRLAASAAGKLAARFKDTTLSIPLMELALKDPHPQVRQYALKALTKCPDRITITVDEIKDLSRDATQPDYVRRAAAELIAAIEERDRKRESLRKDICRRCHRHISAREARQAIDRFGRPYCQHCFDEILLENVNFERDVETAKRRRSIDGTAVQSKGEKLIADWLNSNKIAYIYDDRFRIAEGDMIRPDFYLPEFDIYIEYWGMNTPEYNAKRANKIHLYQRASKKLISLTPADTIDLDAVLKLKLSRYIHI